MKEIYLTKRQAKTLREIYALGESGGMIEKVPSEITELANMDLVDLAPISIDGTFDFNHHKYHVCVSDDGEAYIIRHPLRDEMMAADGLKPPDFINILKTDAVQRERRRDTRWRVISLVVSLASILIAAASLAVSIIVAAK